MATDPTQPTTPDPGLPPVLPPSGKQFLQLFVVPAMIVAVLVGLFLAGPWLLKGVNWALGRASADARSAEQFLRDLDNTNTEIRYRAASDLAQVLLRKDELASDVEFALGLSDRLKKLLDESGESEKSFAGKVATLSEGDKARELKKLEADRNLITYLAAGVGHLMIPTGVEPLSRMATQSEGMEPEALLERRGRALFALATLGDKLSKYDDLPDDRKIEIEASLDDVAERNATARTSLEHLRARRGGKPTTLGVAGVLEKTAIDDDPYLRQLTALAATFWYGSGSEEKAIEDVLVRLSNDVGTGWDAYQERLNRNPDSKRSRVVVKKPGYNVAANATLALARRGSERVRLDLVEEMLKPDEMREMFVIKSEKDEKPDEAQAVDVVLNALRAMAKLHAKNPRLAVKLRPLVAKLEQDKNVAIAAQAKETRLAMEK